ncbi:hypothetical protein [Kutzneria sp. 744]|uniref:hypothetical protein n=1 Tax=Kutzneria sp. (strain 744) TaxID=345341 RepID=UPI0018DCDC98|nr:hypothetical protein [Kutzneria sp. 744]
MEPLEVVDKVVEVDVVVVVDAVGGLFTCVVVVCVGLVGLGVVEVDSGARVWVGRCVGRPNRPPIVVPALPPEIGPPCNNSTPVNTAMPSTNMATAATISGSQRCLCRPLLVGGLIG